LLTRFGSVNGGVEDNNVAFTRKVSDAGTQRGADRFCEALLDAVAEDEERAALRLLDDDEDSLGVERVVAPR